MNKRVELHSIESVSQILARPQAVTCRHRVGSSQKNKSASSSGIVWQQPRLHSSLTGSRVESGHFHAQLYIYYTDLADMDLFLTLKTSSILF